MSNAIELKNVTKDYGDFKLDNVSLALPTGYIMGLIGPNGAGKTTMIKLIMNLIMKNAGEIEVLGLNYREHEVEIKQRIGFVYDLPNFYEHLSLKQLKNIIAPFYKRWDDAAFDKFVQRFDLPLNKVMKKFSRGMQMKSAIALAFSHYADLIIMDEPTSGLDPISRREFLDLLRDLMQDEKRSILFSTHITSDIEGVADYITFILGGKIVFSSSKDEIMENYAIVKGGHDQTPAESNGCFVGIRQGEFGFEALTRDVAAVRKKFGSELMIDRASLEDIMYYSNL